MIQTISNLVSRDFLYRQKLRQFFIFQKHQWIDSFIIIIASSLSKLMRILAESVLTPVKARFSLILFIYHPEATVNTIVEGSQNGVFCWIRRLAPLMKAQKLMGISAWSYSWHLVESWNFHPSSLSGFLSNYNKQ